MEPKGSLPCLQESANSLCPELDAPNPQPTTLFSSKIRSNIVAKYSTDRNVY